MSDDSLFINDIGNSSGEDEPEVYHTSNAENRFDTAAITPNEDQIDAFTEPHHAGS